MRRARADLLETFGLVKGIDDVDYHDLFKLNETGITRGHQLKCYKPRAKLQIRKFSC